MVMEENINNSSGYRVTQLLFFTSRVQFHHHDISTYTPDFRTSIEKYHTSGGDGVIGPWGLGCKGRVNTKLPVGIFLVTDK